MKRTKIQLLEEDLVLGPAELQKKYGLSSRGHAHYILKKGYFWQNYLQVEENFAEEWAKKNINEIKTVVRNVVSFKSKLRGIIYHDRFKEYKEDLFQEGILYILRRAGEIEAGEAKLWSIACSGVDHAIVKYFYYGYARYVVRKFDFFDDESINAASDDEVGIDEIFSQVQEEIASSFGEKAWGKVWSWAKSRNGECPDDISEILKAVAL